MLLVVRFAVVGLSVIRFAVIRFPIIWFSVVSFIVLVIVMLFIFRIASLVIISRLYMYPFMGSVIIRPVSVNIDE